MRPETGIFNLFKKEEKKKEKEDITMQKNSIFNPFLVIFQWSFFAWHPL